MPAKWFHANPFKIHKSISLLPNDFVYISFQFPFEISSNDGPAYNFLMDFPIINPVKLETPMSNKRENTLTKGFMHENIVA